MRTDLISARLQSVFALTLLGVLFEHVCGRNLVPRYPTPAYTDYTHSQYPPPPHTLVATFKSPPPSQGNLISIVMTILLNMLSALLSAILWVFLLALYSQLKKFLSSQFWGQQNWNTDMESEQHERSGEQEMVAYIDDPDKSESENENENENENESSLPSEPILPMIPHSPDAADELT